MSYFLSYFELNCFLVRYFMTVNNDKRVQSYVSEDIYKCLQDYANHNDISISKAVADLIIQGLITFFPDANLICPSYLLEASKSINLPNYVTRDEFNYLINDTNRCLSEFSQVLNDIEFRIKNLSVSSYEPETVAGTRKNPSAKSLSKKLLS
jgi:hypothetical protein